MIFVTVGTQLPFDRLIKGLDSHFGDSFQNNIHAQIGESRYKPRNFSYEKFHTPLQAENHMKDADLVIAHAGTGSILSALQYQTPIIILPRKAELKEHRNDHQLATANWAKNLGGVFVAETIDQVTSLMESDFTKLPINMHANNFADAELLEFIGEILKEKEELTAPTSAGNTKK